MPIARPKRAPQRSRHDALLATHVERRAALILRHDDDTRIAGEALHRFERRVGSPRSLHGGLLRRRARRAGSDRPSKRSPTPTPQRRRRDTSSRWRPARRPVGSGNPTSTSSATPSAISSCSNACSIAFMTNSPNSSGSSTRRHSVPRAALRHADNERASHARRASCTELRVHVANLPAALLDLRRRCIECVADAARPRRAAPPRASALAPSCTTAGLRETRARCRADRATPAPFAPFRAPPTARSRSATTATLHSSENSTSPNPCGRRTRAPARATDRSRHGCGSRGGRWPRRARRWSDRSVGPHGRHCVGNGAHGSLRGWRSG